MKCIRNNLITKNLIYDFGKTAKWNHLELLFQENPGYRGIRLIPKLTVNHIQTNKIPKMNVKHATQIFAKLLEGLWDTLQINPFYLLNARKLQICCFFLPTLRFREWKLQER